MAGIPLSRSVGNVTYASRRVGTWLMMPVVLPFYDRSYAFSLLGLHYHQITFTCLPVSESMRQLGLKLACNDHYNRLLATQWISRQRWRIVRKNAHCPTLLQSRCQLAKASTGKKQIWAATVSTSYLSTRDALPTALRR